MNAVAETVSDATESSSTDVNAARAADLAAEFRARSIAADATKQAYKEMALDLGRLAVEMKEIVPHGQWAAYCKRELGKDANTVLDYRDVYLGRADIKPESTSIREMLRDIEECNLPPQHVPKPQPAKAKSGACAGFDSSGSNIQTGTRLGGFSADDHMHHLSLGFGMLPTSVLNTRNSIAWLLRVKAWSDGYNGPETGPDAALAELLYRWCCPEAGSVCDTRPSIGRLLAAKHTGREYGGDDNLQECDLLVVHLNREAEVEIERVLKILKQDRFAVVIADDLRDVTRAMNELPALGAQFVSDAVLLSETPIGT